MLNLLLQLSPLRPAVRVETIERRDFDDQRLRELHALSNALMAERFEHFCVHARTNDVVHVFRRVDTGAIVGFQFWKTAPIALPRSRAIVGGKLRIAPDFRTRGLHLASGLLFLLETKRRAPRTRFYRLSIASLFGFVSITEALAQYEIFDPKRRSTAEDEAVREAFLRLAGESNYHVDDETGLFLVNIFMTEETLSRYPPRYFDRPAARRYAAVNPGFRTNGCYAGFWFRFTSENLFAMTRAVARRLFRKATPG
ncbi:hypothetical protein BE04_36400 [Sorangium cellulosum]|uniref:N-acetyltransferase domain-containing protein n=2 Tax=Sorangium cellulosum TaxID=56 RepID=A0A150P4L3_SORCE|nr:hypothetical protein [Sorangium cellulosum]AGP35807.1 hypothetical protein SCE1572_15610 [Sorangium cellulosum So0157-2]KYF50561.1 hypothetical protein BE04_36400 [Sorangium cellulosum]